MKGSEYYTISILLDDNFRGKVSALEGLHNRPNLFTKYPKYNSVLAKILERLLSQEVEDKLHHYEGIIAAADEVVESIDRDELAKVFSINGDPEKEEFELKIPVGKRCGFIQFAERSGCVWVPIAFRVFNKISSGNMVWLGLGHEMGTEMGGFGNGAFECLNEP
ncbi:tripeptidyl peptidase 2 [Artemisia annua]|uniref:Tripeptidyl peptidase 2 n=1 Tax=Artemisia annua TaxID=35608 RepID=A0A2U1KZ91_ARTAN|nr:tripeptidyl peptidase 2 [Artemisia annua]